MKTLDYKYKVILHLGLYMYKSIGLTSRTYLKMTISLTLFFFIIH